MAHLSYDEVGITEPEEGIIEFTILPEHLKLLRATQLCWSDQDGLGVWAVNGKRPYGAPEIFEDIKRLVEDDTLTHEQAFKLHKGAAQALQIILKTGKFRPKIFRAQKYSQDWHEYTPKKEKKSNNDEEEGQLSLDVGEE